MSIRPLVKELQEKAITELFEVPNRIEEDINHIREWCSKQPHLNIRTDDQWLLNFLRGCKFSLQRTKEKLDLFYTMRTLSPEFFWNINPLSPEMQFSFTQRLLALLPMESDVLSPRKLVARCKNDNPEAFIVADCFGALLMLLDTLLYSDDSFIINGIDIIIDLQDFDYVAVAQVTPKFLKKTVILIQNAYPTRIKGVYFLNIPHYLQFALNIIMSLLSEKLKQRVHLYTKNNIENIYKHVPRSVLPEEYGGYAGSFNELSDKVKLLVESHHDILMENSKYSCDETKRIGKSKYSLEFSNDEGSFRKLNID